MKTQEITELNKLQCKTIIYILKKFAQGSGLWWDEPLINTTEDNQIILEWWKDSKNLTLYIDGETVDYIKIWGADIDNQMQNGVVKSSSELNPLWKWLCADLEVNK